MNETFQTPGPVTLSIRIPKGNVELEAAETDETRVEVESLHGTLEPGEVRVEMRDRGGRQEIVVHSERGLFRRTNGAYRVAIRAPRGSDVDVDTGTAEVASAGTFGSVDVKTGSGDVALDGVEGAARIKTGSGEVKVASVGGELRVDDASGDVIVDQVGGDATVRSASGSVELGDAGAGVRVTTASGDVRVGSVARGGVHIQSASGDIEVGVRPGSSVFIDAKSMSGEMRSELDVTDTPSPTATPESPELELKATTMSGDVTIRRAS